MASDVTAPGDGGPSLVAGRALAAIRDWMDRPAKPARGRLGQSERAGLLPWAPVHMGVGIGLWFILPDQPGAMAYAAAALLLAVGISLWLVRADHPRATALRLVGFAAIFLAFGFGLCGLRSLRVEGPVLGFRYYGAIEGRVVEIDRSARDRIRLTLDQPRLDRMPPERVPRRIRISLPDGVTAPPPPGTRVMLTGHLGPPPGPSEPGGFDFRRAAWFESLGAIGYTRSPVMIAAPPQPGGALRLHRLRMDLSAAMQARIGGHAGAVASALMTGDRSGISEATNQMMRDSNLFHIISISGLHMGMLAGFVYGAVRLLVVALLAVSERGHTLPAHKVAAVAALLAAAGYLWLSGGGVATERAFLMVAVMLGAILADRRALSLRTVALAAVVILALAPEALLSPGFQMSFAATIALIAVYPAWQRLGRHLPWLLRPLAMLVVTSVLAGIATSPIAAAHFGRMAHYGVLANLLVVPVTGVLIMPMGPLALLLAPFGLEGVPLWLMGLGTRWMLGVGEWVAGLNGAVSHVIQPGPMVLPMMGAGAVLVLLCRGAERGILRNPRLLAGGAMLVAAAALWLTVERPLVLVSGQGDAVGIMSSDGRALSKAKGGAFTAADWLEKDGDGADQAVAAARPGWDGPVKARHAAIARIEIQHLTGKGAAGAAADACRAGVVIVTDQEISQPDGDCLMLDAISLRSSGALAGYAEPTGGITWISEAEVSGHRPWSQ